MKRLLLLLVGLALVAVPLLVGSASARQAAGSGEVIACAAKVVVPATLPAHPTGHEAGGCGAFGPVNDSGTTMSTFTLIGNPPKAVKGTQTFVGKRGSVVISFRGATAPVAFSPGPPPTVSAAVAIAQTKVVRATGAYARWTGKSGVNAAYENDATKPASSQLSILLP